MTQEQTTPKDRDALVTALLSVGGAWARYGLSVGRSALETSARTLETTAAALGEMAERIEKRTQPEELQAMDVPSKSDAVKRA